jgi:quercetin dioxygenase-like cupin family protein
MANDSITKVSDDGNPTGTMGQQYLASGVHLSLRKWENEEPGEPKEPSARDYETAGYVLGGKAELHIGDQIVVLETGDSWIVNRGVTHTYKILETFSAIEATSPPAQAHGRDE